MKRALCLLIPASFILMLIIPGCYTVVMHPADEGDYHAAQTSDCTRCHGDYHEYPYGYYYSPYPSYWWQYENYGYYYAYPWWWSYYDYPYLDGDYTYESADRSGTKFDRRDVATKPARPPHSLTSGSGEWNNDPIVPGLYTPGGGSGTGTDTPAGTYRSKDENTAEENKPAETPSRPTRPSRSTSTTDQNVKPDDTQQTEQPKDKPEEKKKKPRRGGGGK